MNEQIRDAIEAAVAPLPDELQRACRRLLENALTAQYRDSDVLMALRLFEQELPLEEEPAS